MTDIAHDPGGGADPGAMLDWAVNQASLNIALYDADLRHIRINAAMCRSMGLELSLIHI